MLKLTVLAVLDCFTGFRHPVQKPYLIGQGNNTIDTVTGLAGLTGLGRGFSGFTWFIDCFTEVLPDFSTRESLGRVRKQGTQRK